MYYINFLFFFGGQQLTGTESFIITRVLVLGRGVGGSGRGILHLTFSESTGPSEGRNDGRGRIVGWGVGIDVGPATVAAAAGWGSLPVISVSSALANLTNYTLPHPELFSPPAHWSRKRGGGCSSTSADNPHIIIRGLGYSRYL